MILGIQDALNLSVSAKFEDVYKELVDFNFNEVQVRMTISAGMSEFPKNSTNKDSLIQVADEELYESKISYCN